MIQIIDIVAHNIRDSER